MAMLRCIVAMYVDTVPPEYPRPSNVKQSKRNAAIIEAYQNGNTLDQIATKFNISIARAHQIIMSQ
jgi:Mor family transcriptional regulator